MKYTDPTGYRPDWDQERREQAAWAAYARGWANASSEIARWRAKQTKAAATPTIPVGAGAKCKKVFFTVNSDHTASCRQTVTVPFPEQNVEVTIYLNWIVNLKILHGTFFGFPTLRNDVFGADVLRGDPDVTAADIVGVAQGVRGTQRVGETVHGSKVPEWGEFTYDFVARYDGDEWYGLLGPDVDDGWLGGTVWVAWHGVYRVDSWSTQDTSLGEEAYERIGDVLEYWPSGDMYVP